MLLWLIVLAIFTEIGVESDTSAWIFMKNAQVNECDTTAVDRIFLREGVINNASLSSL